MRYLYGLIALLFLTATARADECATLDKVRSDVSKWTIPAKVKPMNAGQGADFLLAFNREPPTSNLEGDLVAVVTSENSPNVVIVIFKGECAAWTLALPLSTFLKIIQGVKA